MVSAHVKATYTETMDSGELVLPSAVFDELGIVEGEQLRVDVVAGTLTIRRESGLMRAKGAGAPWKKNPPLSLEEEKEAAAQAIAEAGAHYE